MAAREPLNAREGPLQGLQLAGRYKPRAEKSLRSTEALQRSGRDSTLGPLTNSESCAPPRPPSRESVMPHPTLPPAPDLGPITADYDVLGELGGKSSARILIATKRKIPGMRRDDNGRAHIEIIGEPAGDESHALQHLASDVKILSNLRHRRLVPVLEGRWLGHEAFAVIRERVDDPNIAERLAQGEKFTNTRTAAILREVHGLLDWAREQQIVHRHVSPDRIFLEPTNDRVRVAFAAGPLPRIRTREAQADDALDIVRLAVAMLTGKLDSGHKKGRSLADLRPDLPERLLEETAALLKDPSTGIDITAYLTLIGMADPVAAGETERDRIHAEVLEEQRVEREKLANERAEFERMKESEQRALAAEAEELRRVFAAEQAELQREFAEAQQAIAAERARMQRILADERAELLAQQQELVREVDARHAEIERVAAADRASIEELREKIRIAGEREVERKRSMALDEIDDAEIRLDTGELATPDRVRPYIATLEKISFRHDTPLAVEAIVYAPTRPVTGRLEQVVEQLQEPVRKPTAWRRWLIPTGIAAAVLVAVTSSIVLKQRTINAASAHGATTRANRRVAVVQQANSVPQAVPASATPAPTDSMHAMPPIADSTEFDVARQWLDSLRRAYPMDVESALLETEAAVVQRAPEAARARSAAAGDSSARSAGDTLGRRVTGGTHPVQDTVNRDPVLVPDGK